MADLTFSTGTPDAPPQSRFVDDKSPICIPFILERLAAWRSAQENTNNDDDDTTTDNVTTTPQRPFFIGLNGVQGVGKTTLVRALAETLQRREMLETLVVSIDDFYLTRSAQVALAEAHPGNALVQYRGEPGTHDIDLMRSFFAAILNNQPTKVPQYDKAAHSGLGDRAPESTWPAVNQPGGQQQRPVQVVIVEGWCVGFRALAPAAVEARWRAGDARTLHLHTLDSLLFVNGRLAEYDDALTRLLDAFVHVDAQDTAYVYDWRLEQEAQLRRERGAGMTDEQVVSFVDAYYPAYELYSEGVRNGVLLPEKPGCQLRLVVNKSRRVEEKIIL